MADLVIKQNADELVGKRIKSATIMGYKEYDDEPILLLIMEDGTQFNVNAGYGGYTGKSEEEYPTYIHVYKCK